MNYGSTQIAQEYAKRGALEEWLQLFLRNDGGNVPFADGLMLEKRYYAGPIVVPDISVFGVEEGAPSYLTKENDIEWFFQIVDRMKGIMGDWDYPPLIVNYADGQFEINDGRHRHVALRQLNRLEAPVIFWTSSEADHRAVVERFFSSPV
ncbi:hypothetical protein [Gorillibacterium sp. CAU 1737]|uniref:hypothetical protein n=1 Tax=Gorillibacterium sp. CAU 1737 TaxID=3140362 RepID=UPI003260BE72